MSGIHDNWSLIWPGYYVRQPQRERLTESSANGLAPVAELSAVKQLKRRSLMSMIGNYLRLPEAELQRVLEKPEAITKLLYPENGSNPSPDLHLDTDKAWHITHFLLTGEAWGGAEPLANAVLGGTEIGDEDVGYGPARY